MGMGGTGLGDELAGEEEEEYDFWGGLSEETPHGDDSVDAGSGCSRAVARNC